MSHGLSIADVLRLKPDHPDRLLLGGCDGDSVLTQTRLTGTRAVVRSPTNRPATPTTGCYICACVKTPGEFRIERACVRVCGGDANGHRLA